MEKQRNIKILTIAALIISVVCLSFALATISSTIKLKNEIIDTDTEYMPIIPDYGINTTTKPSDNLDKQESVWNVRFKNLSSPILNGRTKIENPFSIKNNSTIISGLDVAFFSPNDSIVYTFDVVNDGNIDAKISSLVKTEPICSSVANNKDDEKYVCNNLKYILNYTEDKKDVKIGDILKAKSKKNLTLKIEYNGEKLPINEVKIKELSISITYIQK